MKTLAVKMNTSPSSLSQMTSGGGVSLKSLERIADQLDVDVADLLVREKTEKEKTVRGCVVFRNRNYIVSSLKDLENIIELVKQK